MHTFHGVFKKIGKLFLLFAKGTFEFLPPNHLAIKGHRILL
jgi:hypothetical protein